MTNLLPAIVVETSGSPRFAVIWLHGLGADGSDFAPVVPELGLEGFPGVRFIFPHAPEIPVTCNGGYVMRAWYDIYSLEPGYRRIDEAGIESSRESIDALIRRQIDDGIPAHRVFLAGFSQGGAVAYNAALRFPERLGGLIVLSTYLPNRGGLSAQLAPANRALPIFAAHGSDDDVVQPELGYAAREFLTANGFAPEWHDYPMQHAVCAEEIDDIGRWLRARLAAAQ